MPITWHKITSTYFQLIFYLGLFSCLFAIVGVDGAADRNHNLLSSTSTPIKETSKMLESRYLSSPSGRAYALSKSDGSQGLYVATPTALVQKFADPPQSDDFCTRSADVNRPVTDNRAVCGRVGPQQPVQQQQQQPQPQQQEQQQANPRVIDSTSRFNKKARLKTKKYKSIDGDSASRSSNCSSHASTSNNRTNIYATCPDYKEQSSKPSNDSSARRGVVGQKAGKKKFIPINNAQRNEKVTIRSAVLAGKRSPFITGKHASVK